MADQYLETYRKIRYPGLERKCDIKPLKEAIEALRAKDITVGNKMYWQSNMMPNRLTSLEHRQLEINDTSTTHTHKDTRLAEPSSLEKDRAIRFETPKPYPSLSIDLSALSSDLSQNFTYFTAEETKEWLTLSDNPSPIWIFPTVPASDTIFPFAVIECGPSGPSSIITKQNEAAIASVYAHNILSRLDDMSGLLQTTTNTSQPYVLFSITVQDFYHDLWVHWTAVEDDCLRFNSALWCSWNSLDERGA